jgi:hypothetical protein
MVSSNLLLVSLLFVLPSFAYQVPIHDTGKLQPDNTQPRALKHSPDYSRQVCSGMWGSQSTYINGTCRRNKPSTENM